MADTQPTETVNPYSAVRTEIAARVAANSANVREIVINEMTQAEITRRAAAVTAVVNKIEAKQKDLKKAEKEGKPAGFSASGVAVGDPIYTKDQVESMKKLREEIEKLEKALSKAFDEGDFSKVLELGK